MGLLWGYLEIRIHSSVLHSLIWSPQWQHFREKESAELRIWKVLPHLGHLELASSTTEIQSRMSQVRNKMPNIL